MERLKEADHFGQRVAVELHPQCFTGCSIGSQDEHMLSMCLVSLSLKNTIMNANYVLATPRYGITKYTLTHVAGEATRRF